MALRNHIRYERRTDGSHSLRNYGSLNESQSEQNEGRARDASNNLDLYDEDWDDDVYYAATTTKSGRLGSVRDVHLSDRKCKVDESRTGDDRGIETGSTNSHSSTLTKRRSLKVPNMRRSLRPQHSGEPPPCATIEGNRYRQGGEEGNEISLKGGLQSANVRLPSSNKPANTNEGTAGRTEVRMQSKPPGSELASPLVSLPTEDEPTVPGSVQTECSSGTRTEGRECLVNLRRIPRSETSLEAARSPTTPVRGHAPITMPNSPFAHSGMFPSRRRPRPHSQSRVRGNAWPELRAPGSQRQPNKAAQAGGVGGNHAAGEGDTTTIVGQRGHSRGDTGELTGLRNLESASPGREQSRRPGQGWGEERGLGRGGEGRQRQSCASQGKGWLTHQEGTHAKDHQQVQGHKQQQQGHQQQLQRPSSSGSASSASTPTSAISSSSSHSSSTMTPASKISPPTPMPPASFKSHKEHGVQDQEASSSRGGGRRGTRVSTPSKAESRCPSSCKRVGGGGLRDRPAHWGQNKGSAMVHRNPAHVSRSRRASTVSSSPSHGLGGIGSGIQRGRRSRVETGDVSSTVQVTKLFNTVTPSKRNREVYLNRVDAFQGHPKQRLQRYVRGPGQGGGLRRPPGSPLPPPVSFRPGWMEVAGSGKGIKTEETGDEIILSDKEEGETEEGEGIETWAERGPIQMESGPQQGMEGGGRYHWGGGLGNGRSTERCKDAQEVVKDNGRLTSCDEGSVFPEVQGSVGGGGGGTGEGQGQDGIGRKYTNIPPEQSTPTSRPMVTSRTPSSSSGKGKGLWQPSFGSSWGGKLEVSPGGTGTGALHPPALQAPWSVDVLSTPAKESVVGDTWGYLGSEIALTGSSSWRRRSGGRGKGEGGVTHLLQKVRGRFASIEARLLSGEFPFRPSSAGTGARRDHGDPRSRCQVALDLTVKTAVQLPFNVDGLRKGTVGMSGRIGGGWRSEDLVPFVCFVHNVTELMTHQSQLSEGTREVREGGQGLRLFEDQGYHDLLGNEVDVLFKADTCRALDVGVGSKLRMYDPLCSNPPCVSRGKSGGRGDARSLLLCTQLCEPFPEWCLGAFPQPSTSPAIPNTCSDGMVGSPMRALPLV